jgi:putative ABC transport system substrate-binding protein
MKKAGVSSILIAVILLAVAVIAEAQQSKKVARIGYVSATGNANNPGPQIEAFRQGLRDLGYFEGNNINVEYRYGEAKRDRISSFVAELVQLNVDVLVVGTTGLRAAKPATKTIPIVMVVNADPVATGIVESLARPGGNITGFTTLARDLGGKRLELLREVAPRIGRVGVLWDAESPSSPIGLKEYESAARALKISLQSLEVRGSNPDFVGAFQAVTKGRVNALITIRSAVLNRYPKQVRELAAKSRMPSMCETVGWVEDGCLVSYSANEAESFRRAATYVDKILKGTKPADLPVEQPTKLLLSISKPPSRSA